MTQTPRQIYDSIVTAEAVRAERERTGYGMMSCKERLERKALREILDKSDCDAGVRFIIAKLLGDQ